MFLLLQSSWDNWGKKGAHEVCSPSPSSKHGQIWEQIRLLRALWGWGTPRTGFPQCLYSPTWMSSRENTCSLYSAWTSQFSLCLLPLTFPVHIAAKNRVPSFWYFPCRQGTAAVRYPRAASSLGWISHHPPATHDQLHGVCRTCPSLLKPLLHQESKTGHDIHQPPLLLLMSTHCPLECRRAAP